MVVVVNFSQCRQNTFATNKKVYRNFGVQTGGSNFKDTGIQVGDSRGS